MESSQLSAVRAGASEPPSTHPGVAVPQGLDPDGSWALAGGRWHWGRPELSDDPGVLDGAGRWIVCLPADGPMVAARFPHSTPLRFGGERPGSPGALGSPGTLESHEPAGSWDSSLSRLDYSTRVGDIRSLIAAGDVYQVNLTRRLAGPARSDHPGASALGFFCCRGAAFLLLHRPS